MRFRLFLCLLLLSGTAVAQNDFSAAVSKVEVGVNETFQYSLTLRNVNGKIEAPDFGGLTVVGGPSTGRSVRIVNGQRSSEYTETWALRAPKAGQYKIGPGFLIQGGNRRPSNTITITASKTPGNATNLSGNANLMVDVQLSQKSAYVGEQLIAVYRLYSKLPDLRFESLEYPTMNGFWTETIEESTLEWEPKMAIINGQQYRSAILKTEILYPQHAGTLSIDPVKIEAVGKRSFFDRYQQLSAQSRTVNVEIKPLPPAPEGKKIGTFEQLGIGVELDRTELPANEAVTLKVKLNGRGNLKLVDAPEFDFPADLEVFDPKRDDKISVGNGGMSGTRTFEYVLIPRTAGKYIIPKTKFAYFDPNLKSFKILETPEITLNVSKGVGGGNSSYTYNSKTDVSILNTDIRFIQTDPATLTAIENRFFGSPLYYGLSLLPMLAFGLIWLRKKQEEEVKSNPAEFQKKRAGKVAKKQLTTARKLEGTGNSKAFYGELIRALHDYLSNKFGIETSELNERSIREKLQNKIPATTLEEFNSIMKDCEMARFAGLGVENEGGMISRAERLIQEIEKEVK